MMKKNKTMIDKLFWKTIEANANRVIAWYEREILKLEGKLPVMPPVPIRTICAMKGLSINAVYNLEYKRKKLAGMLEALDLRISYEARDILGRQNFSISHELGHFLLHWEPFQNMNKHVDNRFVDEEIAPYFRCTDEDMTVQLKGAEKQIDSDKKAYKMLEREANEFASLMLMPSKMVRKIIQHYDYEANFENGELIRRLSHDFEVSEEAMGIRLTKLRIKMDKNTQAHKGFLQNI